MVNETWMEDIGAEIQRNNQSIETQTAQITSDTEANKRLLLKILRGIDFFHSRLPQEFLNKKTNPRQPYGDFQVKIETLIQRIENDTSVFEMDITAIDRYLFLMAKILAGAIASGCQGTAAAARKSLTTGFLKVRSNCMVLQNDASRQQYLQKATAYLNDCYLYISVKNMIDITDPNLEQRKKSMQTEYQRLEESKDHVIDMIMANPVLLEQMQHSLRTTFLQSGKTWSPMILQLYEMLVQFRISESRLNYESLLLDTEMKKRLFYQDVAGKLGARIVTIPAPEDVTLMEKFGSMINSSFEEAERADQDAARLDEMMSAFEMGLQSISYDPHRQAALTGKTYQKLEAAIAAQQGSHKPSGDDS